MDWTRILANAGVPDAPGYQETLQDMRNNPKEKPVKKPVPKKGKGKK